MRFCSGLASVEASQDAPPGGRRAVWGVVGRTVCAPDTCVYVFIAGSCCSTMG